MAIHELSNFRRGKLNRHHLKDDDMEHNILVTTISGPIDYATVNAVAQVRFRSFEALEEPKVASIIIFQGSMKVTPDAVDLFAKVLQKQKTESTKTLSVAYVAPLDIEDRNSTCTLFQEIFYQNGIAWQVFEKLDDAQEWARLMVRNDRAGSAHHTN